MTKVSPRPWILRAVCLGALSSVAACGGSGSSVPAPAPTWALVAPDAAYLAYAADAEAGLPVPDLMPRDYTAAGVNLALGVQPVFPPPPGIGDGLCSFPAHYDLRDLGRVTPARDPLFDCGACWTSATMGSLESYFAPVEMDDFSEAAMQLEWGGDFAACGQGGNSDSATYYLASWRGPVDEADYPVPGSAAPVRKHVQNVYLLPDRQGPLDNCWIKYAVTHIGGVYTEISDANFSPNLSLYNTYYHPTAGTIHAVTIVGWDDDFDRNLFYCGDPSVPENLRVPAGNGAFIVKDNGGPSVHDQGFYYVSYYDGSIGTGMAVFTAEPVNNYSRMYRYDPYGVTDVLILSGMHKDYSWQGNVFTALADEKVVAVGFYEMYDPGMDYQVRVYLDPVDGPTSPQGPAAVADLSLVVAGCFTVPLPQPVPVKKGQRFGVVLRGHARDGGWPAGISIEAPQQSYVSVDGTTWQDLTTLQVPSGKVLTDTNVCVKAFTQAPLAVTGKVNADVNAVEWTIGNEGSDPHWVRPVARLYPRAGTNLGPLEGDVFATQYREGERALQETSDGWILVQPGTVVTAYGNDSRIALAKRVRTNLWWVDPHTEVANLAFLWKILADLLDDPLEVVATEPASGAQVNYLGLGEISVTFDEAAKPGPGLLGVSVTSPSAVKAVTSVVSGNQMHIYTAGPLGSNELGGTTWTVHLPADAALTQDTSSPLANPYDFSFTVTGVN